MVQKKCEYYGIKRFPPPYLDCGNCEVHDECQAKYWRKLGDEKTAQIFDSSSKQRNHSLETRTGKKE